MADNKKITLFDKVFTRIHNSPLLVSIIIFSMLIIGLAKIIESKNEISSFLNKPTEECTKYKKYLDQEICHLRNLELNSFSDIYIVKKILSRYDEAVNKLVASECDELKSKKEEIKSILFSMSFKSIELLDDLVAQDDNYLKQKEITIASLKLIKDNNILYDLQLHELTLIDSTLNILER